jgi:hypothetical protein
VIRTLTKHPYKLDILQNTCVFRLPSFKVNFSGIDNLMFFEGVVFLSADQKIRIVGAGLIKSANQY